MSFSAPSMGAAGAPVAQRRGMCYMSEENKKTWEPAREGDDSSFGHKESGQIEPIKFVETPLPEKPASDDDDD